MEKILKTMEINVEIELVELDYGRCCFQCLFQHQAKCSHPNVNPRCEGGYWRIKTEENK